VTWDPANVEPFVIYRVVAGSRAFGLATDTSDEDRRGVYLPPADWHWCLDKPPEQVDLKGDGVEEVVWEVEKFLRLALNGNPNILEVLWAPVVLHADETGRELRAMRSSFLSRRLHRTYSGYVASQFRLLEQRFRASGTFKPKHAMHLIRLLLSGLHAVRHGDILVNVGEHRDELMAIRRGERTFDEVRDRANELIREFDATAAATRLPDEPDTASANRFLLAARRRRAGE
jgi:predicted nucleotidyltransferase